MLSSFFGFWGSKSSKNDELFAKQLVYLLGFKPKNIYLYKLAVKHNSASKNQSQENNERLEFLGDSVLGMIVAELLFKKYPRKDEGFLTEIRSRIVNRESLNEIAVNIGLNRLIQLDFTQKRNPSSFKSANGNALEALVGAVYLDKGFKVAQKFVIEKIISENIKVEDVVLNDTNFKSKIIEWAQKENKEYKFVIAEEKGMKGYKIFVCHLIVNEEIKGLGEGQSKKKAEQEAAKNALEKLNSYN